LLKFTQDDLIINLQIGEQVEIIDLRTCLAINDGDLPKEYTQQPSWYAFYASILASQEDKLATVEREYTKYKADISLQLRQGKLQILDSNNKSLKLTEGAIQNYIDTDEHTLIYQQKIQKMQTICKKLKSLVNGSIQRKDMLIQLGLLERQERKQIPMNNGLRQH